MTPPLPSKGPLMSRITLAALVGLLAITLAACSSPAPTSEPAPLVTEAAPEPVDALAEQTPTPEPEPTEEPVKEEPEVDEEARAADLESQLKVMFGVGDGSFTDLLAQDPSLWAGYIASVRTEGSRAFITLQVAPDDPSRDVIGERAATALKTLLPAETVDTLGISWVIVEDAGGVVIAQEQPAPLL